MDKNKTLAYHFRRRAEERFGFNAHRKVKNYLIKLIQNNGAEVIERQSLTRGIYKINIPESARRDFNGLEYIYVVYDKGRHKLVTILTEEMLGEEDSD